MPKHRRLLIVLADGEHVRFVRPAADNALRSDTTIESVSAHKRPEDIVTDRPGAGSHADATAHHSLAPRHDPHALEKEKFAHLVAQQLNGPAQDSFDELVLVAPAHSLNAIRDVLDPAVHAKIVGTLAKDLVKTPDHELWPHLRAWVRPTHRES